MDEIIWNGAAELRESLVQIGDLTRHPDNPRRGVVEEIAKGFKRFGQVKPILIDDEGIVIAGNHRLLAVESLGWTHIAVVRNSFTSAAQARKYLLADNRVSDLGEYDKAELLIYVEEQEKSGRLEGTGYTNDDLDHIRDLVAAQNAPPPEPPPVVLTPPDAPPALREVVLLFTEEQQVKFGENVRTLRPRYGLEGVTETVLRAIHDEALLANQGKAA